MTVWTDDWVGLPYQECGRGPNSYDCLGLFVALQRERHGRAIFDPMCTVQTAMRKGFAAHEKQNWRLVGVGHPGSAILFKVRGLALHIAYALDDTRMLHTGQDTGQSLIEAYRTTQWGDRLEGIYEYAG